MRLITTAATTATLLVATIVPAQAMAETKVYPHHGANYCPTGLQPVTISGVICCGKPNQHISYTQALAHPVKKRHLRKHKPVYSARAHCPAGTKGCS